ncbi:MAG: arsenate reductase ArsC [Candidatus Wallbacteria bacterium]
MKLKVLFVCTHNSCRSQIAEGLMNALLKEKYEAASAGTEPTKVNINAINTLREIGIDISSHYSKNVDEFKAADFDFVVTVCDSAQETCPYIPGARKIIHHSFNDPSNVSGTPKEIETAFRSTRDEIKNWILETFKISN